MLAPRAEPTKALVPIAVGFVGAFLLGTGRLVLAFRGATLATAGLLAACLPAAAFAGAFFAAAFSTGGGFRPLGFLLDSVFTFAPSALGQ
jgi:hypothetical protein